jgi:diacylglycerol O-acyltransferase / wax synthase
MTFPRSPSTAAGERLSDEDERILAHERGTIVGHICKVLVVDGEHDVDAFRARVESRLAGVPRLRDRLEESRSGASWVPDRDFAIDRQVRDGGRVGGRAELARAIAALMETRLERDRPLWSLDVMALDRRRTAAVLRLHHCMADGSASMRIIRTLLLDQEAPAPGSARRDRAGAEPARERTRERLAILHRELGHDGRVTLLARPAGPRRTVAFATFPLVDVKRLAHAVPGRATVNDVVLAAVAGGLRHWLACIGVQPHELRVKVPVSLHRAGDTALANRDSFMVVHLPLDEPDPLTRLSAIAAETRERKAAHDADAVDALFTDVGRLSRSLARVTEHWAMSPRVFALNVSNVPGPQGDLTVLGSRLLAMHALAEIADRHALRVAVVSAAGRLSFGLCADAEAVQRLDLVTDGIDEELRALGAALPA